MLIAGVWHGSSIPFVLWGLLQGLACAVERIASVLKKEYRSTDNTPVAFKAEHRRLDDSPVAASVDSLGAAYSASQDGIGIGQGRGRQLLRLAGVFLFINVSWLIFRSSSVREIALYLTSLKNITQPLHTVHWFVLIPLAAAFLLQIPGTDLRRKCFERYVQLPVAVKVAALVLFCIGLNIVSTSGVAPFIYFGF